MNAFCQLKGFTKSVSYKVCGGGTSCSGQQCAFTQCEKWYKGSWTNGNCDGASFAVLTQIVCSD